MKKCAIFIQKRGIIDKKNLKKHFFSQKMNENYRPTGYCRQALLNVVPASIRTLGEMRGIVRRRIDADWADNAVFRGFFLVQI